MAFDSIKVPFIGNKEIKRKADDFRKALFGLALPLDIEGVIEKKLKMSIAPITDLRSLCNSDALISSNWKTIYVDHGHYMDDRYIGRLRFSFAHELGHFTLHKNIYEKLGIKEISDLIKFIEEVPQEQYSFFETQAGKFASHLLIPREILEKEKEMELEKLKPKLKGLTIIDEKTLNPYLSLPLAETFGVSSEAIEIALGDLTS